MPDDRRRGAGGRGDPRSGARAGDDVWVSGTLGDAMLALAALAGTHGARRGDACAAARRGSSGPTPRVALGQALRGVASAMLDVSDGLTGDLAPHPRRVGRRRAIVDLARVPRSPALDAKLAGAERALALDCLLAGGDDYELCFTAPPATRDARRRVAGDAERAAHAHRHDHAARRGLVVRDERGEPLPTLPHAFDHFA